MPDDDEGLLRRVGRDPDAFESFYRRHVEEVQRFVARRVASPHHAADLTADVFLRVVDAAHTYRPGRGSPTAWLFGVARNVVAEDRRSRGRAFAAERRLSGRRLLDDGDLARAEARIDAQAGARRLYEAMDALSEKERAVLELVALEGLSAAEAAGALGIRPIAARVRLHRARTAMRARLGDTPASGHPHPRPAMEVQS